MLVYWRVSTLNIYPIRPHHVRNAVIGTFAVETATTSTSPSPQACQIFDWRGRPEGEEKHRTERLRMFVFSCDFPGVFSPRVFEAKKGFFKIHSWGWKKVTILLTPEDYSALST